MGGVTIPDLAKDLLINILNIIILFVIVKTLIYKPVKKFLDARTKRINDAKNELEEKTKQVQEKLDEYNAMLAESKDKRAEIIGEAERTAKENSVKITENAKESARAIFAKAQSDIEAEHTAMLNSLQGEVAGLAVDISKQILKREFNDDDNLKIAESFFSEKSDVKESSEKNDTGAE